MTDNAFMLAAPRSPGPRAPAPRAAGYGPAGLSRCDVPTSTRCTAPAPPDERCDGAAQSDARLEVLPVVEVHRVKRTAHIDGLEVVFQPREIRLLELLARPGHGWLSHDELCRELAGEAPPATRHLLAQYVYSVRRKLGRLGAYVDHRRGLGYRCLLEVRFVDLVTDEGSVLL